MAATVDLDQRHFRDDVRASSTPATGSVRLRVASAPIDNVIRWVTDRKPLRAAEIV